MTASYSNYYYALLFLLLLAANWSFFVPRRFVFLSAPNAGKKIGWHLLELVFSFLVVLAIGYWMEGSVGQPHSQDWEFYAVLVFLFFTFAFPGFVWRFLLKKA